MFKYLFKALLLDGTILEQNSADLSTISPGKNCYYDVIQAEKAGNLRAFAVYNQETGVENLINLENCHFECNYPIKDGDLGETVYHGQSFTLHGDLILSNIRLIWFIRREMILDVVNTKILTNQISSYNFGFQANDQTGNSHKFIITLN